MDASVVISVAGVLSVIWSLVTPLFVAVVLLVVAEFGLLVAVVLPVSVVVTLLAAVVSVSDCDACVSSSTDEPTELSDDEESLSATVLEDVSESAVAVVSLLVSALFDVSELPVEGDVNVTLFVDEVAAAASAVLSLNVSVELEGVLLSAYVVNPDPKNNAVPNDRLAILANTHRLPDL